MNSVAHPWLAPVLMAWAAVFLFVLVAMLRSIVSQRQIARTGPPACRASTAAEAAWTVTAIVMVVLMVLLTIR
ncbi:MAG: hypothetical protein ABI330_16905 [Caldimonas sp.]